MLKSTKKTIFLILAWTSIILAILGIPLPLLPTTPFVILAAFFFSKSSSKWHNWLLQNKKLGPMLKDWQEKGAISVPTKIIATVMMTLLFSYTVIFVNVALWIKTIVVFIGIAVMLFIHTRPSH